MSNYCDPTDLDNVIENFTGDYFGTDAAGTAAAIAFVTKISSQLDEKFRGIPEIPSVPVGTQIDGDYPATIKRLAALSAVNQKLMSRVGLSIEEDVQRRLDVLREEQEALMMDVENGKIVFESRPSSQEGDISPAYAYSKSGAGNCISNHDGWGGVYSGTDFDRYYKIKIVSGGAINQAVFEYSRDDGVSYEATSFTAGTDWQEVENNLYVRFTGTNSSSDFLVNDAWRIHCVPVRIAPEGGRKARIKHFTRG